MLPFLVLVILKFPVFPSCEECYVGRVDSRLLPPLLTRRRMWLACGVAVTADLLQLAGDLFPGLGWVFDEGVDLVAMVVQSFVLGFHPLLLPTFLVKAVPGLNALPTWTGCTLLVIGLRRKQQTPTPAAAGSPPPRPVSPDVIDV